MKLFLIGALALVGIGIQPANAEPMVYFQGQNLPVRALAFQKIALGMTIDHLPREAVASCGATDVICPRFPTRVADIPVEVSVWLNRRAQPSYVYRISVYVPGAQADRILAGLSERYGPPSPEKDGKLEWKSVPPGIPDFWRLSNDSVTFERTSGLHLKDGSQAALVTYFGMDAGEWPQREKTIKDAEADRQKKKAADRKIGNNF